MLINTNKIKCNHKLNYNEFGELRSFDCEEYDCPFYISENDSGYYPCCIKDELIKKYKLIKKGK